jgi:beta-lactamase regulating signal transducer with metallopeptidase domain/tetratricopeptide (TPR) repeat protein
MVENVAAAARFALDVALKATVLLSITAVALIALRRASAAARQLVATLGLAGTLALPVATLFAPRWEIPLLPSPVPRTAPARTAAATAPESASAGLGTPESPIGVVEFEKDGTAFERATTAPAARIEERNGARQPSPRKGSEPDGSAPKTPSSPTWWMFGTLALWSVGTLLASARLALGAARVARIRRCASDEVDEEWTALSTELKVKLGLARPVRLLFSDELAVPVTAGLRRPVVLLPEGARRWNDERRRVVLLHELAHVKRRDWMALLTGQAAAALYWFHPLAWSTRLQMQKDCERACDDLVLSAGTRASAYAAHLLSIIRSLRLSRQRTLPAVAMARRSYWDGRMRAILDPNVPRRVVSGREARVAVGALIAVVVALAVVEPWASRRAEAMSSGPMSSLIDLDSAVDQLESSCKKESSGAQPAVTVGKKRGREPSLFLVESSIAPESAIPPTEQTASVEATAPEAPAFAQASRKQRKNGGDWYSRGMDFHNDERYDEAIEAFRHSIEEGHRVEAATYNIACGYARKGDADRAFEWLQKAMDEGFELSSHINRDDDLDSLRSDPRFAELRRAARAERTRASKHRADRLAERFRELRSSRSAKGGAFYSLGKDLLEVGRYDLAGPAFQISAARGYREGASLYNTACALSLGGDKAAALDYLQKALETGFDDPGLVRRDDDLDNVRGEPRYRELLEMAQDLELHRFEDHWNPKSWSHSGRRAAWREVEQRFVEYTQRHPQSGRAWFNLGYARIEGERPEAAIEAFQRALDLRYRTPTTMYNLACAYSLMNRRDEAFSWLFKALDAGFQADGRLRSDDDLDNLRGDPRFRQALARAKSVDDDD